MNPMTTAIIVKNVEEAIRYKNKFPHILADASLYFPDDEPKYLRPKRVDWLYYTDSVGAGCRILYLVESTNKPVLLHI